MNNDRDLTKEEVEEIKKERIYIEAAPISEPKTDIDGFVAYHYGSDKDLAKVLFIIGAALVFIASVILTIFGFVDKNYILVGIGAALLVMLLVGTIIRFNKQKNDVSILKGRKELHVILGTIIALHITPLGIISLICYLSSGDSGVKDITQKKQYISCNNSKQFVDLYNVLTDDFKKGKITEEDYNSIIDPLMNDLNKYVNTLDSKIKVTKERIRKGVAKEEDLEKEFEFVKKEKEIASVLLNK